MSDYKKKYLKYKQKYLLLKKQINTNLVGGTVVPKSKPPSQSWLFMPIILAPFNDIEVKFGPDFGPTIENFNSGKLKLKNLTLDFFPGGIKQPEYLINKMREFYLKNGIDLSNSSNLRSLYTYDFDLHILGNHQVTLLERANIRDDIENLTEFLIAALGGKEFTFRKKT